MKFCKDCKHYTPVFGWCGGIEKVDPVKGGKATLYADVERASYGECKPEGFYWQPDWLMRFTMKLADWNKGAKS